MRLRTAVTATVLAAIAVLGGAGFASADDGFNNDDVSVTDHTVNVVEFGDLVMD
jgi:hypothetical protein